MYTPIFKKLWDKNRREVLRLLEEQSVPDLLQDPVVRMLDNTDFYEAPASTRYHGARPGGLFDHSVEVARQLIRWTDLGLISWERPCSPCVIGLLHDFTKAGKYLFKASDRPLRFKYAEPAAGFGGHGIDSLGKVLLRVPINQEEAFCIRWHMGPYEGEQIWTEYDTAIKSCPQILWVHHADMVVSKVLGV